MQTATIQDLKKELSQQQPAKLLDMCLRLARFKKENKELLTYLLFEAENEEGYIRTIKHELDELMPEVKHRSTYRTHKNLRKVLRLADKYIRYSGNKQTEVELRLYFLKKMKEHAIFDKGSRILANIHNVQVKKIQGAMSKLHEDLQYDYGEELKKV